MFTSIASGSTGNCYLVRSSRGGTGLIELGIPWKKILPAIDFQASALDFALVSHSHGDHSKTVKNALSAGVEVYLSLDTASALGVLEHHRTNIVYPDKPVDVGGWKWQVLPFSLEHDSPTLGFVISDGEDKLLFVPDTAYVKNRFQGITIAALECNHISEILINNVIDHGLPAVVARRIRRNHMSLENLLDMIKANDFSKCRQLWLIHLSDGNSCEETMKRKIQELTGIPTYFA